MSSNKASNKTPTKMTEPPTKDGLRVLRKSVTQLNNAIKILNEFSEGYTAFETSSFIVGNDREFVAETLSKGKKAGKILQDLKDEAEVRIKAAEEATKAQQATAAAKAQYFAAEAHSANNQNSIIAAAIAAGLAAVKGVVAATEPATIATKKTPQKGEENGAKRTRRVYAPIEELCFKQFVAKHPTKSPGDIHLFKAFLYTEKMNDEVRKGLAALEDNQIKNKLESVRAK